jgi:hypothetical protein
MSYLERPSKPIPWAALKLQFGCEYGRTRAFRERFLRRPHQVLLVYPRVKLLDLPRIRGHLIKPDNGLGGVDGRYA